jgi:hypothetical protein
LVSVYTMMQTYPGAHAPRDGHILPILTLVNL